jgi:hypothetical protein
MRAGPENSHAHLLDMSRTGAFVTSMDPKELGSVTQLELMLRPRFLGMFGHWVRGEVMWRGPKEGWYGVGVRFVGEHREVGQVLDTLVSTQHAR